MTAGRLTRALALSLLLTLVSGCGSFWSIADTDGTLEDSVRTYAKLMRWGEVERASMFVEEESRGEFIALAADLRRLRITDFDLGPVDQPMPTEAHVTIVYSFYDLTTLVERQVSMPLVWTDSGSKGTHKWFVRPDLTNFEAAVRKPRREPAG